MEEDFLTARRYFEDALERDKRVNGTNAVPISVMRLVWVLQAQGRLHEALELVRKHEAYIRERGSRRFYIGGVLNLAWGEILLEWNQLVEAEAQIREGLRLLDDWPVPQVRSMGLSLLVRLQIARGDLPTARETLHQAEALQRQSGFYPVFADALERLRVRLWIVEQNREALEAWADQNAFLAGQELRFRYEARRIDLCRAWVALGRREEAAALLERLAGSAGERNGSRMVILPLLAAANCEEPTRAWIALEEALRLGEPEGYLRVFVNAGEAVRQVLKAWLQRGPAKDERRLRNYAQRVLAAFDAPTAPKAMAQAAELPEPISGREREVLVLVAKGLTNQQIAARLVISIRTVKKHVENIHGKLGVQNRTQAVARARELRLLDDNE
jgi:LuxR family transcriptional regulator, maltose regulon positive regulatory protein